MNFGLNKRQKIIVASVILTIGLLLTQLVPFYLVYRYILALALLSYLLSLWALWEGISKLKAVVLLILPVFFTISVSSFYFLLPVRWLTRLPVALLFGLSFYSLLLSQNVFNVASIRTIPLYRAASTVSFLFTLITAYLLFNVIFSFDMLFVYNGLAVWALSFLLSLQLVWTTQMEDLNPVILVHSFVPALVVGEVAAAVSFWPVSLTMVSLALAGIMYVLLSLVTYSLKERLSKRLVWEFVGVGVGIFVVVFFTTSWTG